MKKTLKRAAVLTWVVFLAAARVEARINLVNLPGRDSVQLTIYNSVDLTLVRETRRLTFRRGMNRLEFSWANTLIDPTSLEFKALTHTGEVELLDSIFPPRAPNTLEWRIQSDFAGEVEVEIQYFTSGVSWSADYVAEAGKDEKTANIAGSVRVVNHSGEDFENAQVRLVVGVIRLVEEIAVLAGNRPVEFSAGAVNGVNRSMGRGMRGAGFGGGGGAMLDGLALADRKREIVKEGLSEYFLYTVEGRDTIPTGWSKRLPSFTATNVPITSLYKYEKEKWGEQAARFYKFKNAKESGLGVEPLPNGDLNAFQTASSDGLFSFVGRTAVKYIPIDGEVELEFGGDREVDITPRLADWRKEEVRFDNAGNVSGWTLEEDWEVELQNSKPIPVLVDLRRNFAGDWTMTSSAPYEKVEAGNVKFMVPLQPREKRLIHYRLTTRTGTGARR